jgi:hypothetical protein
MGAAVGAGVGAGVGLVVGLGLGVGRRDRPAAGEGAVIDSTTDSTAAAPAPSRAIRDRRETSSTDPSTVAKPASTRSLTAKATIS